MSEIEGERSGKADEVGDGDPFVSSTDGEHLWSDGPGDGEGVELLDLRSTPNIGTFG